MFVVDYFKNEFATKKLYVLTESIKKYGVENLWSFLADDLADLAKHIVENDGQYESILSSLGGSEWTPGHRRYRQPTPDEFLDAFDASFGEDYYYQTFELDLEKTATDFDGKPVSKHKRMTYPEFMKYLANRTDTTPLKFGQ